MKFGTVLLFSFVGAAVAAPPAGTPGYQSFGPPKAPDPPTPTPTNSGFVYKADDRAVTRKYRLWTTKTYGDDHFCLTEIEFYDQNLVKLNASFVSMSSCYGCGTCESCTHRYGNPRVLFDWNLGEADNASAWACTAPGTYSAAVGSQAIVFKLDRRPMQYVLYRPQVNGDWVNRDYSLEEQTSDGQWVIVDQATDVLKVTAQKRNITMAPIPLYDNNKPQYPPWFYEYSEMWHYDYPACAGSLQSPINLTNMDEMKDIGTDTLPYNYMPMKARALAHTGTGLQVAGILGTLTLPDGVYVANQFHFHFPAEHRIVPVEDHLSMGELHIIHQKIGSNMTNDIAIVAIMLHLPKEHDQLKAQEKWFINLGMLYLPQEGNYTLPYANPIDFSIFDPVLQGRFWSYTGSLATPPCTEGVKWFVMENYAYIPGVVVNQFKARFPNPRNARPQQQTNGRAVCASKVTCAESV